MAQQYKEQRFIEYQNQQKRLYEVVTGSHTNCKFCAVGSHTDCKQCGNWYLVSADYNIVGPIFVWRKISDYRAKNNLRLVINSKLFLLYLITKVQWLGSQRCVQM